MEQLVVLIRILLINTRWEAFECDKEKTMKYTFLIPFLYHYFLNQIQCNIGTDNTITEWLPIFFSTFSSHT